MEKREDVLKRVENEEIKITNCDIARRSWEVSYKINSKKYSFSIYEDEGDQKIRIYLKRKSPEEEKKERINISKIINRLRESIENSSLFRLKILLEDWKVEFSSNKYVIYDLDNFEARKSSAYIEEKKDLIDQIIKDCIQMAKGKNQAKNTKQFLVIKEEDELPLFDYLLEKKYMGLLATCNEEKYLKLTEEKGIDEKVFYKHFKENMKELGYNLYYDNYVGDEDADYWSRIEFYDSCVSDDEHEDLVSFYVKKRR